MLDTRFVVSAELVQLTTQLLQTVFVLTINPPAFALAGVTLPCECVDLRSQGVVRTLEPLELVFRAVLPRFVPRRDSAQRAAEVLVLLTLRRKLDAQVRAQRVKQRDRVAVCLAQELLLALLSRERRVNEQILLSLLLLGRIACDARVAAPVHHFHEEVHKRGFEPAEALQFDLRGIQPIG